MKRSIYHQQVQKIARTVATLCLVILLGMLVIMNLILYSAVEEPASKSIMELCSEQRSHEVDTSSPPSPDENVPENNQPFSEEYIQAYEYLEPHWRCILSEHTIAQDEHSDSLFLTQFTPPPEQKYA